MLITVTIPNIDEDKWLRSKAKWTLQKYTIQEGIDILLDNFLKENN